jgi:hypothetical protein
MSAMNMTITIDAMQMISIFILFTSNHPLSVHVTRFQSKSIQGFAITILNMRQIINHSDIKTSSGQMAYNVLAVYDVFAVAIKEREAFQQTQKCGEGKPHKGRKPGCGFS